MSEEFHGDVFVNGEKFDHSHLDKVRGGRDWELDYEGRRLDY